MVDTPPVVPPVVPPPAAPWYGANADPALVAHLTNHGWHQGEPGAIALAAATAHKHAQGLLGVPADQIVRLPKEAGDTAGWDGVFKRLGMPGEAKEYDFAGLKFADGTDADAKLTDAIRAAAFANRLPKDAAKGVAGALVRYLDEQRTEAVAARTAAVETERAALAKAWGANADANKLVATRAVEVLGKAMGLDQAGMQKLAQGVSALEGQVGYSVVMDMFRTIGSKMGEDKFVPSLGGGGPQTMTPAQAQARLTELKADKSWASKLMQSDNATIREFQALTTIISGDDTEVSRRA